MTPKFVDEVRITVSSGAGGRGCVSFHRRRGLLHGKPDGGDGGRGGDLIFAVKSSLRTLNHLTFRRSYAAEDGSPGGPTRRRGRSGQPLLIEVPPGTLIKDLHTRQLLKDFAKSENGTQWICLPGAQGGQGNWHYRSGRGKAAHFAQPGEQGATSELLVEISTMADIGLVGFPSAGKSTLLNTLTGARSPTASYPFTTVTPHLGVLSYHDTAVILADIPGIMEGASSGVGLGVKFLKHIYRTVGLILCIDLSQNNFLSAPERLLFELGSFNPLLREKPQLIVGTKLDLPKSLTNLETLKESLPGRTVLGVSSFQNKGLPELREAIRKVVECSS